jgi:hypothetical protein
MEGFTKCEVEEAKAARKAQGMLGHPTDSKFLGMVCSNMIPNCSITEKAVKNANLIFVPDLAGVRERTERRPPKPVCIEYVQILRMILDWHWIMMLAVDCMFVKGVPFLVGVSGGLNLITAKITHLRQQRILESDASWNYMPRVVSNLGLS